MWLMHSGGGPSRVAFLVVFGGLLFAVGIMVGERLAVKSWGDGYATGYQRCEIDFWVEQRVARRAK